MAVTKFEICSRALNSIGFGSINSFTDDNDRAATCSDLWPTFSKYILSIYPWYFTQKKIQMAREVATPVNEYRYKFTLPGDLLRLNGIYASGSVGAVPIQDFDMQGNVVLANDSALWADYQQDVITEGWPDWFVYFAIKGFALELAEAIPTDPEKRNILQVKVWGNPSDNLRGGLFGSSMAIDSKQRPAQTITDYPLVNARFV